MDPKTSFTVIFLLLSFIFTIEAEPTVFDISKFGAKADGRSDISKALLTAWNQACATQGPSKVVIPKGLYFLAPVDLKGPCKGPKMLEVRGILRAPEGLNAIPGDSWITFSYIDQFTLFGEGTFDGQGELAWKESDCRQNPNCKPLQISLQFKFITNSQVTGVTSLDSKNFHVKVSGCKNFTFERFTIRAPADSINTDGIHIGRSNGINIIDSLIGTGDDCISIGDGSQQVHITGVTCGPGHGISVGSLGKYKNEDHVSGIFVRNCTISNNDNGVRIKTWPASYGGIATDIHFEDVVMNNVKNPIIIDQLYCPSDQCNLKIPSKVKLSNISFKNIKGSSAKPEAIQLTCSASFPCERVELANINLVYSGKGGPAKSTCANVKPILTGMVIPPAC